MRGIYVGLNDGNIVAFAGGTVQTNTTDDGTALRGNGGRGADALPPLRKMFKAYNSGLVSMERTARDAHLLAAIGATAMRIDVGMGWDTHRKGMPGVFGSVVEAAVAVNETQRATAGSTALRYDFSPIHAMSDILHSVGATPVYSWCYTPTPLQANGDWRSGPTDLDSWYTMHRNIANATRSWEAGLGGGDGGSRNGNANAKVVHEIYNEPDLSWSLTASWSQYLLMYKAAASAIRDVSTYNCIIGPAAAVPTVEKLGQFLSFVDAHNLPLCAISVHAYGSSGQWQANLAVTKQALREGPARFASTPIHINELNTVSALLPAEQQRALLDNFTMASSILGTISALIADAAVEQVHWAQFLESGFGDAWGMVTADGVVKAAYNAFVVYNRMPVEAMRVEINAEGAGSDAPVGYLASFNATRVAVAVWSSSDSAADISIQMPAGTQWPFAEGVTAVYRIDREHCSFGNSLNASAAALLPVTTQPPSSTNGWQWRGALPGRGVVYLEVNAAGGSF